MLVSYITDQTFLFLAIMCWSRDSNDRRDNLRRRNFTKESNNESNKKAYNCFKFTNLCTQIYKKSIRGKQNTKKILYKFFIIVKYLK
jgi:hypothetical protein